MPHAWCPPEMPARRFGVMTRTANALEKPECRRITSALETSPGKRATIWHPAPSRSIKLFFANLRIEAAALAESSMNLGPSSATQVAERIQVTKSSQPSLPSWGKQPVRLLRTRAGSVCSGKTCLERRFGHPSPSRPTKTSGHDGSPKGHSVDGRPTTGLVQSFRLASPTDSACSCFGLPVLQADSPRSPPPGLPADRDCLGLEPPRPAQREGAIRSTSPSFHRR